MCQSGNLSSFMYICWLLENDLLRTTDYRCTYCSYFEELKKNGNKRFKCCVQQNVVKEKSIESVGYFFFLAN